MQQNDSLIEKGSALVKNSSVQVFEKVRVAGIASTYARLLAYTDSREIRIECLCKPVICYTIVFPPDISGYIFNEGGLTVEIRGGDGRRLREFDSEWWKLEFISRYDYERIAAMIYYYCSHRKEENPEMDFCNYNSENVDIKSIDDAPILDGIQIEEYSLAGRLTSKNSFSVQFMSNPLGKGYAKLPGFAGGYVLIRNGEIEEKKFISKHSKTTLAVHLDAESYQIKRYLDGGESEIWTFLSEHDFRVAYKCFELLGNVGQEGLGKDIKMVFCPVCRNKSFDMSICKNCGFSNLEPTFVNREDAEEWMTNVVIPYRKRWIERNTK